MDSVMGSPTTPYPVLPEIGGLFMPAIILSSLSLDKRNSFFIVSLVLGNKLISDRTKILI
jgi:hypothetical protein